MEDLLLELSIGEVARRAGIRPSAIRYYEEVGLLPEAERVGGERRYEEGVLRCLMNIRGAKRAGFTIEEMRILLRFPRRDYSPGTLASARSPETEGSGRVDLPASEGEGAVGGDAAVRVREPR
jgi:DNA-binding transcriptional MerR regulator